MEQTNEPKKSNPASFGLSKEEADKVQDILPTYPLGEMQVGETVRFIIRSDEPEIVKHKQKDDNGEEQDVETPVLKATELASGLDFTLWLSSKSLKMEMLKVSNSNNASLKDVPVIIGLEEYKHEKFGKTRAYRVQRSRETIEQGA